MYIKVSVYRIAGKFGEFGESSVIHQTKTIQIFTYNYYLMAESIHSPNFSSPNAHNSEICQTLSPPNFPAMRYYTSFSANNSFMEYFCMLLSCELFGIQECFSVNNKATSSLLGGIEVSYPPVHSYNILVITCVLGFALQLDLGNN